MATNKKKLPSNFLFQKFLENAKWFLTKNEKETAFRQHAVVCTSVSGQNVKEIADRTFPARGERHHLPNWVALLFT